jgi:hypothetical protein
VPKGKINITMEVLFSEAFLASLKKYRSLSRLSRLW